VVRLESANEPTVDEIGNALYESLEILGPTVRTALLRNLAKEYGIIPGRSISLERLAIALQDYLGTCGAVFIWDIKRILGNQAPNLFKP
jgi:hypothetical protein